MNNPSCPLCKGQSSLFFTNIKKVKNYFQCSNCHLTFLDQICFLSSEEEKKIYLQHENNVLDEGYQKFVSPLVNFITENFSSKSLGLDFGSGTGQIIFYMLNQLGYQIMQFDPFFNFNEKYLDYQYDYIVTCEVAEHFHHPFAEFQKLRELLLPDSSLIISTSLFSEEIDFKNWYYHRDPTHVMFYQIKTFEWIKNALNFRTLTKLSNRLVVLST
jgi:hypothetical protein